MVQIFSREEACSKHAMNGRRLIIIGSIIVQGVVIVMLLLSLREPGTAGVTLAPIQGDATACRIVSVAPFTDAWIFGLQPGMRLHIEGNTSGCNLSQEPLQVTLTGQNSRLLPPLLATITHYTSSPTLIIASAIAHPLDFTDMLLAYLLALVFDVAGIAILLRSQARPLAYVAYALFYSTSLIFCLINASRYNYLWVNIFIFFLSMLSRGLSTTFVCLFPHPAGREKQQVQWLRLLPYIPTGIGVLLAVAILPLIAGFSQIRFLVLLIAFCYNIACIIVVIWVFFWGLRKLSRTEQQLMRMVTVGIIFLLIPLALTLNVVHANIEMEGSIIHLVPIPIAVLPIICDYALFRHQLVGTASLLSRRVMRVLLWILLASLFVFPGIILLHYLHSIGLLQGDSYDYLFAALLVGSLCLFPLVWNKVRDTGDLVFYRDFYQYNRSLRELSADLTRIQRLDELQSHVLPHLATLLNTNDVALLVRADESDDQLQKRCLWNLYHYATLQSTLPGDRLPNIANLALTHFKQPSYEPLLLDNVLLLALYDGEDLRGFLCLGPKRNVEPYSRQDTSFLATLASQLAVLEVNHRYLMQAQADAQKLVALNRRVISAQEEERKHLALDLHDEVLQQAMLLVRQLSDASTMSDIADTMPLARSLVTSLRRTCLELRPPLLDELGLEEALSWLARQTEQRSGRSLQVHVSHKGIAQARPPVEVELALYRVGQEALSNALKYAEASNVMIRLRYIEQNRIALLIRDNGRGFRRSKQGLFEHIGQAENLGLIGMYERMASISGKLQIRSRPGHGVTIRALYAPFVPVNGIEQQLTIELQPTPLGA